MNEMIVKVVVAGEPHSQPRPRFVRGRVISNISPAVSRWQLEVETACRAALCAIAGRITQGMALRVDVTFYFGTKKSERWGKPHTMKPDRDNCDKLILDEATKAGLFGGDDCRVSAGMIRKYWVNPQGQGAVIEIYEDTSTADINGVEQRELPFEKPGWLISAEGQ